MRRALATAAIITLVTASPFGQAKSSDHWVATWTTAVVARPAVLPAPAAPAPAPVANPAAPAGPPPLPPVTPNNQTLRQIVRTSIAGTRARVVFANTFGTAPLNIGGASIALRDKESAIVPASVRKLAVNGSTTFRVPAGALVLSDPVDLSIPARSDLAIDLFVPDDLGSGSSPITFHNGSNETSYASSPGNHTGETSF